MKPDTDRLQAPTAGPLPLRPDAALLTAFGIAYYALAVFAAALPAQTQFPLFIYPADGLALGAFLVASRARWAACFGIVLVASLAAGLQSGAPIEAAALAALANAAKPAIVAAGLQRLAGGSVRLGTLMGLTGFLVNLVPLVGLVSFLDAALAWWRFGAELRPQWTVSFVSDFLGMILGAPLVIAWSRGSWSEAVEPLRGRVAEVIVLYAGLVATTHLIFRAPPQAAVHFAPLAYLCSPFLLWAALRFGLRAATAAILAFALICYWHTAHGLGPFGILGAKDLTSLLYLQGFLATAVVTTLFAAALLAEREDAAQTTEAWRRRYEAAIRASGNLLYELDPASGTILWDGDTQAVLGAPAEEISTVRKWAERIHPQDRERIRGIGKRLLAGAIAHIAVEYRVRRAEGEWITVGVNGYAIEDPARRLAGRRIVIGFVSDVSERVRADEERQALAAQLRQAEKMEAVGRLAGGIAHDFNNILGAILGYGELAQSRAESDPQLKRYIDTIVGAGNRAKSLVSQILAYSRVESGIREPVDLASVVNEVRDLLRGSSSASAEVRLSVPEAGAVVLGDPTRMHQVVMNLASNAIQAMAGGGVLEIGLSRRALEAPVRTRLSEVPGRLLVREVFDIRTGRQVPQFLNNQPLDLDSLEHVWRMPRPLPQGFSED